MVLPSGSSLCQHCGVDLVDKPFAVVCRIVVDLWHTS